MLLALIYSYLVLFGWTWWVEVGLVGLKPVCNTTCRLTVLVLWLDHEAVVVLIQRDGNPHIRH